VTRLKQLDLGIDDIPYPVSDTSVTKILPSIRKYGQYHRPIAHPIFLWPNVPNTCETRMTKKTSFQTDIRPLFAECDIQSMSKAFNLEVTTTSKSTLPPSTIAFVESAAP
jgi:hypothetical protein